jgi:hypothetical protein
MQVAAIIYGAQSGIVRRIVVSDSLKELAAPSKPEPGEDVIIVTPDEATKGGLPDMPACIALVEAKIGKPAENARCIVVNDKGEIETVILADPAIDVIGERKALYQHPEANPDWKIGERGEFEPPVREEEAEPVESAPVEAARA